MNEQELRELYRKHNEEKLQPIIRQITELVCKAYAEGLDLGLSLTEKITQKIPLQK